MGMIPLEHLEKIDRALLRAAAECDAPLPYDAAAQTEIRRRVLNILRLDAAWRPVSTPSPPAPVVVTLMTASSPMVRAPSTLMPLGDDL